ncbi:MAG TPA: hypothetical protein VKE95_00880 [Burkholderiales bacterium]|nr:hypothetical protein [Burkholderiales bacterium]
MRLQILALAAVLALAAGCNKGSDRTKPAAGAASAPPQSQANTPTTPQVNTPTTPAAPASSGQTASQEEKKEGANPQQGQVDPKSPAQHRDFQQKGDDAGPKSPETAPKPGN